MQSVRRVPLGISTDSIASPSARRQRYFLVPSADCWITSAWSRGRGCASVQLGPERGGQLGGVRPPLDRGHPEPAHELVRPVPREPPVGHPALERGPGLGGWKVEERSGGGEAIDHGTRLAQGEVGAEVLPTGEDSPGTACR